MLKQIWYFFDVAGTGLDTEEVVSRLSVNGVRIGSESKTRMRAVTHLDVDKSGVEKAADLLASLISAT